LLRPLRDGRLGQFVSDIRALLDIGQQTRPWTPKARKTTPASGRLIFKSLRASRTVAASTCCPLYEGGTSHVVAVDRTRAQPAVISLKQRGSKLKRVKPSANLAQNCAPIGHHHFHQRRNGPVNTSGSFDGVILHRTEDLYNPLSANSRQDLPEVGPYVCSVGVKFAAKKVANVDGPPEHPSCLQNKQISPDAQCTD